MLPVKGILHQRISKGDPVCLNCGEKAKTVEHALLMCKEAQEIWKMAPVQWSGLDHVRHNFWLWWEKKGEQGIKRIELTAYILWHIWKNRNKQVFDNKRDDGFEVVQRAIEEWLEFKDANKENERGSKIETGSIKDQTGIGVQSIEGIKLTVSESINKIRRMVGYCITTTSPSNRLLQVWGAAEEREGDKLIDEANAN